MHEAILNSAKPAFKEDVFAAMDKYGADRLSCFETESLSHPGLLLQAWMRRPARHEIHKYQDTFMKSPSQANEVLVKQLWVVGDEELRSDERYTIALHGAATGLLGTSELTLKKF